MSADAMSKYRGGFISMLAYLKRRARMDCVACTSMWRCNVNREQRRKTKQWAENISDKVHNQIGEMSGHYKTRAEANMAEQQEIIRAMEHQQYALREQVRATLRLSATGKLKSMMVLWKEQRIVNLITMWRTASLEVHFEHDNMRAQLQVDIVNKFAGVVIFKSVLWDWVAQPLQLLLKRWNINMIRIQAQERVSKLEALHTARGGTITKLIRHSTAFEARS